MNWVLPILALSVLAVAAVSGRLTGTPVTPAMVFVTIGVLVGPEVGGEVDLAPTGATVRTLAEATLALVLFSDASRIRLSALRREYEVPLRLLGVGLPLTIAAGAAFAVAVLGQLTLAEATVLAVLLAPTDAALGQAVVTEPRLPSRIRQGLNVESGLNDGICVPLLLIALAAADVDAHLTSGHHAIAILAEALGYGLLGGVAAGLAVVLVVRVSGPRQLITPPWMQVVPVGGAGLAYGLAAALGGSGFIAAFVAGALFGALLERESETATRLTDELGQLLNGVTFVVFGAVLLGPALAHVGGTILLYSVLSLTLVRIAPVAIAMLGSGARAPTVGFLGWFGPRGLASIVFAVIAVEHTHLPHVDVVLTVTYLAVGLSVFAHGVSAAPLAARYARWYESHPSERRPKMESAPAAAHRPRGPRVGPAEPLAAVEVSNE
ncbi:MAG TPA: cation:proton antiporter [Solirubrobacteraceae bacterium]|jgi:NhaP-type Na+/H+ or K+/H+ antiporter|nr:cation:proton antiporter [Solirubrobacteraceae bacterium]